MSNASTDKISDQNGAFFWSVVPSWLTSVVVHLGVFFFCMTSFRNCGGGDMTGDTTEQFREVGIFVRDEPVEAPTEETNNKPIENIDEHAVEPSDFPTIDDSPPAELTLPENDISIVGGGAPSVPASAMPNDVRQMVTPGAIRKAGQPGLGQSKTSFFDIREQGDRFVYLIDSSGSMGGAKLRFAKQQLSASLQQLTAKQEFQIIFYNEKTHPMELKTRTTGVLFRATTVNKNLAQQFISSETADYGTDHMPAIYKAIRLRPQVLFFLTDGTHPAISRGELEEIRRRNAGTRIHCIEFGEGAQLVSGNWVERLARENDGTYRYRDVLNLGK